MHIFNAKPQVTCIRTLRKEIDDLETVCGLMMGVAFTLLVLMVGAKIAGLDRDALTLSAFELPTIMALLYSTGLHTRLEHRLKQLEAEQKWREINK